MNNDDPKVAHFLSHDDSFSPDREAVITVARVVASMIADNRKWWQFWKRRYRSPIEFIIPARAIVSALIVEHDATFQHRTDPTDELTES